jgi:fluoroacetyl-CoA thioesterase
VVTPTRVEDFVAEGDLLTDVGGTLPTKVLSTPGMILVMEWACTRLIQEHVPEAPPTVGFEVCVKHVGGAVEGTPLTVAATLREIVDGRKFRFDVEVREGARTIGVGTHERRALKRPDPGPAPEPQPAA